MCLEIKPCFHSQSLPHDNFCWRMLFANPGGLLNIKLAQFANKKGTGEAAKTICALTSYDVWQRQLPEIPFWTSYPPFFPHDYSFRYQPLKHFSLWRYRNAAPLSEHIFKVEKLFIWRNATRHTPLANNWLNTPVSERWKANGNDQNQAGC